MSLTEHEIDIRTGRRGGDGHIHVSIFAGEMVALTLEGHGERAPTMLLTLEQARRLQLALTELIPLIDESERQEEVRADLWRGEERRLAS
ncbi:MAG TPA: hypothetical protein VKB86_18700 [Pyrinomonadaceae bacterium]|nr:hypothetical protein [Pyrinomonadaceae bacterium]